MLFDTDRNSVKKYNFKFITDTDDKSRSDEYLSSHCTAYISIITIIFMLLCIEDAYDYWRPISRC